MREGVDLAPGHLLRQQPLGADVPVGTFRSDGWFNKHSLKAEEVDVPPGVENAIKGRAIDTMRRLGRIGPKGTEDITGDKWRRPPLSQEGCP
ncbi:hypothetical protein [Streptomyces sp. NPDC059468]|uniref:hypothetical protein n=1 Tax=Streptomyces sp. NPDC059468 TaxID=3346845 RepID=UPI003676A4D6